MKKIIFLLLLFTGSVNVSLGQFTKLYDFPAENDLASSFYSQPVYDGTWLYEFSYAGGANGLGCIFKIRPDGSGYSKLLEFSGTLNGSYPYGSLTLSGTVLYGMTYSGGTNNYGTIFKINTDGTGYTKLLDFSGVANGRNPYGSLTISGSILYGMTRLGGATNYGTIFKINTNGTGYTKLLDFSSTTGIRPYGSLALSGTTLFGMTNGGGANGSGAVFKINTDGTGFTKLLDFAGTTNGSNPYGSLTISGSVLYGTTCSGGANSNYGTIFKINTDGTGYTKLLDFAGTANGSNPYGSLIISGSLLYGTTTSGGANGYGTLFKISTDGTGYTKLLDFNRIVSGSAPQGTLTLIGSVLYGTTKSGGMGGKGIIFKINTDGSSFTKILEFNKTLSGNSPVGCLTVFNSVIYGITSSGGNYGYGTIYKINSDGSGYVKLLDFEGTTNGRSPWGALTLSGSVLYGVTDLGGANNYGILYKINTNGTGFTKLLDFNGVSNGSSPNTLTLSGSVLYGMTFLGGVNNYGTIFKINTDGTGYTKLLDFEGVSNGSCPMGSLTISGSDMYGVTNSGGVNNDGTVFKISTNGTGYSKLLDFEYTKGVAPNGTLILSNSILYGMTGIGGTYGYGTIFRIGINGQGFVKLRDFAGTPDGSFSLGSLVLHESYLYGMTDKGGTNDLGIIFKISTDGFGFSKLVDFNGVNGKNPNYSGLTLNANTLYGIASGGAMQAGLIFKYGLIGSSVDNNDLQNTYNLSQNYPNPFDQFTTIDFNLVKPSYVNLTVFNSLGQEVDVIVDEYLQVGTHSVQWNPKEIPAGIYFYQLKVDGIKLTKRLVKE